MASSSRNDNDLEYKICEMSTYLDRLVTTAESQISSNFGPIPGVDRRVPQNIFLPPSMGSSISHSQHNSLPILPQINSVPMSTNCPVTNVTSALASRINIPNSNVRFVHSAPPQRSRKWLNAKQAEEFDTSGIDIDATMAELGLAPDSLTNNEVYRLFSSYKKLAFYIHGSYIFEDIYEARTLPNTMNASVQTRHAVWSSNKLLRYLRDTLRKYSNVPVEYQLSLGECKQSLDDLHAAILKLDAFKFCDLEHRKGKFISPGAREIINPLIKTFDEVIECIGKSRMYVEVFVWNLNKSYGQEKEAAVGLSCSEPLHTEESLNQSYVQPNEAAVGLSCIEPLHPVMKESLNKSYVQLNEAAVGLSCGGPPHRVVMEESLEQTKKVRPSSARRYIG